MRACRNTRAAAVEALGELGDDDTWASLVKAAKDEDELVRNAAASASDAMRK